MLQYIERLRRAPLEERRRAAFFWTIVVVVLIVFVWIFALGFNLNLFSGSDVEVKKITPKDVGIEAPY